MGIAHWTLTMCKYHYHFLIAENEKKIVDLHLWMTVDSKFHVQIGHWLAEKCVIVLRIFGVIYSYLNICLIDVYWILIRLELSF